MTADPSYNDAGVYLKQGANELHVTATGAIIIESGGQIEADGVSTPTVTAPANTGATNSSPYGFSQAQANAITAWIIAVDAQLRLLGLVK